MKKCVYHFNKILEFVNVDVVMCERRRPAYNAFL